MIPSLRQILQKNYPLSNTSDKTSVTVYLALGSNIEPRLERLHDCARKLAEIQGCTDVTCSHIYESEALDMAPDTAPFLNQVVKMQTTLPPEALLQATETLEKQLGRKSKGTMQSRTIDIDILLYGERNINTKTLTIPHPRLSERTFVLIPLLELDKTLKNPQTGQPYRQLSAATMVGTVTQVAMDIRPATVAV